MVQESIPVMGFIDLVGISEENICNLRYKLKNVNIKPNAMDEHSINVEIELEIFCRAFEDKEINIIQDMYSPSRNLEFNQNNINTMVNMRNTKDTINIREKVKLENNEYDRICDAIVNAVINDKNIQNNSVNYSGDLDIKFILLNSDETRSMTQEITIPFTFSQDIQGVNKDSNVDIRLSNISQEFTKDNMDVTVKIDLQANTNSYNIETIGVIDNIEEVEGGEDNPYSMVIYFVKPDDTLWKIAKKYKSTVEDIARINNIENVDRITPGKQLFIPKCSKPVSTSGTNA